MRAAFACLLLLTACATTRVDVDLRAHEAEQVLAILDARAAGKALTERDWARLFATEGYRRLKQRESSMGRELSDEEFRRFVMSDELLKRRAELRATLQAWRNADLSNAARQALAFLPKNAGVKAKVYPVIKPKTNSFVFDLERDPAIFIYLEPLERDTFEGIVAHEFHHIGYAAACKGEGWLTAFGEGIATYAAANGGKPRIKPDALAEWERQQTRERENFEEARDFLQAVQSGKLDESEQKKRGMELFGIVGPWYTVGYRMASVIDEELGRDALIAAFCDQHQLLATYNVAARKRKLRTGEDLPLWPDELVNGFPNA
ncbi:MAG: hypothetical protein JOZ54_10235 [Acidobacteria bacterium]|nr:hypothetical protein [Acidobacteriota bacterium]